MRTLLRRVVLAMTGLSLLAAPITVVGGSLEHRHNVRELATNPIPNQPALGLGSLLS